MSDTEEDSLSSESWPINEDWLIEVLKKHHEVRSGIKITVSFHSDILSLKVDSEYPIVCFFFRISR